MNNGYRDILERIPEPPRWWDEHAVPRYCLFSPGEAANIYAEEVVLLLIECQDCGQQYQVCMSGSKMDAVISLHGGQPWSGILTAEEIDAGIERRKLSTLIENKMIHYGDPPNACTKCVAGSTMNSVPKMVLEYWRRSWSETKMVWLRVPELEVDVTPTWATEES